MIETLVDVNTFILQRAVIRPVAQTCQNTKEDKVAARSLKVKLLPIIAEQLQI